MKLCPGGAVHEIGAGLPRQRHLHCVSRPLRPFHSAAVRLFADPPRRWYSSIAVVSETHGWFLHRLGEEEARTFRLMLADLPRLRLLGVDAAHHRAVGRKLDQFRGHRLTYVDASSLVFLHARGIHEVWGTDADLGLEGAKVLPVAGSSPLA